MFWRLSACSYALPVSSRDCWGNTPSFISLSARSKLRLVKGTSGPSASTLFFSSCAWAALRFDSAPIIAALASRTRAARFSLSSSASTCPGPTRSPTWTLSSLMMPLAFDLISTFVIGSMRPVATTDLVMSPRSTWARREVSISFFGRDITTNPMTPNPAITNNAPIIHANLRDFFLAMVPSDLVIPEYEDLIPGFNTDTQIGQFQKRVFRLIWRDSRQTNPPIRLVINYAKLVAGGCRMLQKELFDEKSLSSAGNQMPVHPCQDDLSHRGQFLVAAIEKFNAAIVSVAIFLIEGG